MVNQLATAFNVLDKDLDTVSKIKVAANIVGVDENTALNIACVESGFDETASNRSSTASGTYQFLNGSWRTYALKFWGTMTGHSKKNENDSIVLALLVMKYSGTKDWNASKHTGYRGGWANHPYQKGFCKTYLV